ncbi:MAG: proton-conducting transporter membrane subunit, partial [Nitrospiraceae bacterium]
FWVLGTGAVTDHLPVLTLLGWVGAAATIVGAFLALSQDDVKRMFAYSGISHIGLIVMGISMGNETGFVGGIFYLINDAVMQAVLFFVAGAAIYRYGARDLADYFQLRGQMPWTVGALIVTALSMIGIPPTGGFFGKWYILLGALEAENYVAVGAIIGVTLLTMAYFLKVIEKIFHHSHQVPDHPHVETPLAMRFSMGALAVTIIALGLMSDWIIRILSDSAVPLGL